MKCISIVSETTDAAIAAMHQAGALADLIEVRVDHIRNPDIPRIIAARPKPLIITVTPASERGGFAGTEQERCALLRCAIECGADYVDVNLDCPELKNIIAHKRATRIIVSYHNFRETPFNLLDIYERLQSTGADISKIATFAARLSDNLTIINLLTKRTTPLIALCMGERGQISRVLGPLYGSYLTFASLEKGKESAPGQIPAQELNDVYRIDRLTPGFQLFGIIGNPVSKSKGYVLHNALFAHYGLNSVYVNFLVDDLQDFAESFSGKLSGFSVTMPHKQAILRYLSDIDPLARSIGAVNTVVNRTGKLIGYNTDMLGALKPLQQATQIAGKQVTIVGAGGAARALAFGIVRCGGKLTVLNRTVAKAARLAEELGCSFGHLDDFAQTPTDILINMTAVGMHPNVDEAPVDLRFVKDMLVLDGVYRPEETGLLRAAQRNGCRIISGLEMFINQAAEQFRLWTGIQPDNNLMREILICSF